MTTREEALGKVEAAFADVRRPSNDELLHPQSFDDMDLEPLYEFEDWRDMSDHDIIESYAAPSFLSALGFRYFMPAYMRYALNNSSSPEAVVSSTIWGLDPMLYADTIADYARSKYVLLNEAQRDAIVAFLEAMRDSIYGDDAERALKEWLKDG